METINLNLAVILTLGREEKTIDELTISLIDALSKLNIYNFKIFFVTDKKTTHKTSEIISELQNKKFEKIEIMNVENSKSHPNTWYQTYNNLVNTNYDYFLAMDAGFAHNPEDIGKFVMKINENYDYICGSRFSHKGSYNGPISRQLVSRLGTIMTKIFFSTEMTDLTSGFDCFSSKALKILVRNWKDHIKSNNHFYNTEQRYLLNRLNWAEVPITYKKTSTKLPKGSIYKSLKDLIAMIIRYKIKKIKLDI